MRVVCYNIYEGGEGRADPLAEVILAQRADLIGLVEADDSAVLQRISHRLKMDYVQATGRQGRASALFSRWTIRESINHGALHGEMATSLLEALVEPPAPPGGGEPCDPWPIGVVHLHHGAYEADEDQRIEQVSRVLEVFDRHRRAGRPHLLMGDFNANAPTQRIDPQRVKPSTRQAWQANGGQIPRRVIQAILDAGYIDTTRAALGQAADESGTFTTQFPGQRVDYIFAWGVPPEAVKQAWIEQDRLARYASDHYPVGVLVASG